MSVRIFTRFIYNAKTWMPWQPVNILGISTISSAGSYHSLSATILMQYANLHCFEFFNLVLTY